MFCVGSELYDTTRYDTLVFYKNLSWRPHIAQKCLASKRLLFLLNKCFRLTWGLSIKINFCWSTRQSLFLKYCMAVLSGLELLDTNGVQKCCGKLSARSFGRYQELLNPLRLSLCLFLLKPSL